MILLYRFELVDGGINFVLNEKIAEEIFHYEPQYESMIRPLVASLSEVLNRYKIFCKDNVIFRSHIFDNNELEVLLSKGMGDYIDPYIKNQIIFETGITISNLLVEVMEKGMKRINNGNQG